MIQKTTQLRRLARDLAKNYESTDTKERLGKSPDLLSTIRDVSKLEAEIKKMDLHYDKLNEVIADGQVHGHNNDKLLGPRILNAQFEARSRWHAEAEKTMRDATYGRCPQQSFYCLLKVSLPQVLQS